MVPRQPDFTERARPETLLEQYSLTRTPAWNFVVIASAFSSRRFGPPRPALPPCNAADAPCSTRRLLARYSAPGNYTFRAPRGRERRDPAPAALRPALHQHAPMIASTSVRTPTTTRTNPILSTASSRRIKKRVTHGTAAARTMNAMVRQMPLHSAARPPGPRLYTAYRRAPAAQAQSKSGSFRRAGTDSAAGFHLSLSLLPQRLTDITKSVGLGTPDGGSEPERQRGASWRSACVQIRARSGSEGHPGVRPAFGSVGHAACGIPLLPPLA